MGYFRVNAVTYRSRVVSEAYLYRGADSGRGEVCLRFRGNGLYYSYVVSGDCDLLDQVEDAISRGYGFAKVLNPLKSYGEHHYRQTTPPAKFASHCRETYFGRLPVGSDRARFAL